MDKVIAQMEGVMGIGFTLGPVLGHYINNAIGFSHTFFLVGLMIAPLALLVLCLPSPVVKDEESEKS